jgi:glutamate/aspartate transport system substrate-binding protein
MRISFGLVIAATFALVQTANAQEGPTLKRIASTKTLNIAYRDSASPFSYLSSGGEPIGYSIDICRKITEAIKEELKLDTLTVKYVPITTQTRVPVIANGTADIECATTAMTLSRFRQIDYLFPTFVSNARLLVKKSSGIKSLADMNGKVVTTLLGTTSEKALIAAIEAQKLNINVVKAKDNPQALLNVEQGRADGFFSDDILLAGIRRTSKNPDDYEIVGPSLFSEPYGLLVARNDAEFRLVGNRVLAKLFASGEINEIYKKWFYPGPTNINIPMSDQLQMLMKEFSLAD